MSRLREAIRLVLSVAGLYTCYMAYGFVQERIHKAEYGEEKEKFKSPAFMVFTQVCLNCIMGFIAVRFDGSGMKTEIPSTAFLPMSLSYVIAMYTSNKALDFVDFPTQVIAKSVKMIPVMLGSVIFLRKRYAVHEYAEVLIITGGISLFFLKRFPSFSLGSVFDALSSSSSSSSSSSDGNIADSGNIDTDYRYMIGLGLSFFSLLCDGVTGTLQEKIRGTHRPSGSHFMLYMNLWSAVAFIAPLLATGELIDGASFVTRQPSALLDILMFGLLSAFGQLFIFYVLSHFGPLVLVMCTTTRKFFSILLSVAWFGNELTEAQWVGASLVFGGIIFHSVGKWMKAGRSAASHLEAKMK